MDSVGFMACRSPAFGTPLPRSPSVSLSRASPMITFYMYRVLASPALEVPFEAEQRIPGIRHNDGRVWSGRIRGPTSFESTDYTDYTDYMDTALWVGSLQRPHVLSLCSSSTSTESLNNCIVGVRPASCHRVPKNDYQHHGNQRCSRCR